MAILINVLLASWLGAWPRQTAAPPPIGFVVTLSGPWQVDGRDVTRGQGVAAGAKLALAPTTRFDTGEQFSIQVVLLNNTPVGCPNTEACRRGVVIPSTLNQRASVIERLVDVFGLIFQSPERWVGLVSRDVGRVNLTDGVVQYERGRVSLAQTLTGIPAGDYEMRFTPVDDAGAPSRRAATVPVSWTGTAPAAAAAPLGAGLYRVILSRKGSPGMVGREAWMLAAGASQTAALRARYDAAVAATRAWEPAVPRVDIDRFLHAYLAQLARGK